MSLAKRGGKYEIPLTSRYFPIVGTSKNNYFVSHRAQIFELWSCDGSKMGIKSGSKTYSITYFIHLGFFNAVINQNKYKMVSRRPVLGRKKTSEQPRKLVLYRFKFFAPPSNVVFYRVERS